MSQQRIDKWLFFARIVKSRGLAQKLVQSGAIRINRDKIHNAARLVRPEDTLTISLRGGIRVLKVVDAGERRGPASEAAALYADLTPAPEEQARDPARSKPVPGYQPSAGPPSKRQRRDLERLRRDSRP